MYVFQIAENDDLPHKICFRCSAKVEELYEFIQKCIKTQENLRDAMGKRGPLTMKSKNRVLWEKELYKTNLSNDDICDVLIKRAMEGIPLDAPLDEMEDEKPRSSMAVKESESESDDDDDAISLKEVKQAIEKADEVPPPRVSRSSRKPPVETIDEPKPITQNIKTYPKKTPTVETKPLEPPKAKPVEVVERKKEPIVEKPKEMPQPTIIEKKEEEKPTKPFNIMDHISTIKVNQVGVLFQCKLCNRNFLRKDTVMNHGCARNHGPPKETSSANAPTVGPPKPPTVQYIKMDSIRKRLSPLFDKTVEKPTEPPLPAKPVVTEPEVKPKPKIGPASRVKVKSEHATELPPKAPTAPEVPSCPPSVSFPAAPSLNSRYKLVPGPNNTFQLVEESTASEEAPVKQAETKSKKRHRDTSHSKPKHSEPLEKSSSPEIIDLDDNRESQREPYPVGLFQPVPHHSSVSPAKPPVPFTTPAMKKQSYTIVPTGNPSKLLISTKPQPVEEPAKKKIKKKIEIADREPLKVTSEPATGENNRAIFTFVSLNAADILQPSYELPPNNIIQESQITTSSAVKIVPVEKPSDSYSCNMCGETFSREKKLLSHIQSHYKQMDEEDERRTSKPGPRRKTRKS